MLQLNVQPFASDALEDAMRLAETKALNSYTFSDCLSYLNWAWMDMFLKIAQADEGYYSRTVKLTTKLTKLPPFVKNTIKVYAAQSPAGFNREIFRESGYNDLNGYGTYHISGFDLWCPDAVRRNVWLNYIPIQPQIFFTHRNRDPKLYNYEDDYVIPEDEPDDFMRETQHLYNLYQFERRVSHFLEPPDPPDPDIDLQQIDEDWTVDFRDEWLADGTKIPTDYTVEYRIVHRAGTIAPIDVTRIFVKPDWTLVFFSCDYPYIFLSYRHNVTGEYRSGFFIEITQRVEWVDYNPFDWLGKNSNVEYLKTAYNDKTGMGVIIKDHNDIYTLERVKEYDPPLPETIVPRIKELGWTPDTVLNYPVPEMYRLLVARLADKLSALNESNVNAIQKELKEATDAFDLVIRKNKSAWMRIDNVNGPTIGDLL